MISKFAHRKYGTNARDASIGRLTKIVATSDDATNGYLLIPGASACDYPLVVSSAGVVRAVTKIEPYDGGLKVTVTTLSSGDEMTVSAY